MSKISNITIDARGEKEGVLTAVLDGGAHAGYLSFRKGKREGSVLVESIGVHPSCRRQGIATGMLAHLRQRFPDLCIEVGYTTDDGEAWAASVAGYLCDR